MLVWPPPHPRQSDPRLVWNHRLSRSAVVCSHPSLRNARASRNASGETGQKRESSGGRHVSKMCTHRNIPVGDRTNVLAVFGHCLGSSRRRRAIQHFIRLDAPRTRPSARAIEADAPVIDPSAPATEVGASGIDVDARRPRLAAGATEADARGIEVHAPRPRLDAGRTRINRERTRVKAPRPRLDAPRIQPAPLPPVSVSAFCFLLFRMLPAPRSLLLPH